MKNALLEIPTRSGKLKGREISYKSLRSKDLESYNSPLCYIPTESAKRSNLRPHHSLEFSVSDRNFPLLSLTTTRRNSMNLFTFLTQRKKNPLIELYQKRLARKKKKIRLLLSFLRRRQSQIRDLKWQLACANIRIQEMDGRRKAFWARRNNS